MADKTLVLVCNSHIDPVWLWPWEEGLAVTLSTFRAAADLCEEFDGFVFCHNEALLYDWVEQHEPALFSRIQRLVRDGRWHVMGGWYLQPDCNLPCGESLVRQILVGKRYFIEKFGVEPRVAVNLDPFGHTRGLVQILAKAGYDGYLFCRPDRGWLDLPSDDFVWVGYDGSTVLAHRAVGALQLRARQGPRQGGALARGARGSQPRAAALGRRQPRRRPVAPGPRALADRSENDHESTAASRTARPEDYFDLMRADEGLPRWEHDLNPWAVGCYTSMATVKRAHARLERGAVRHRVDARERRRAGAAPLPARRTARGARGPAVLPVPRRPPGRRRARGRAAGARPARPRPGDRRPPARPRVLRAARRTACGGRRRVPDRSCTTTTRSRSTRLVVVRIPAARTELRSRGVLAAAPDRRAGGPTSRCSSRRRAATSRTTIGSASSSGRRCPPRPPRGSPAGWRTSREQATRPCPRGTSVLPSEMEVSPFRRRAARRPSPPPPACSPASPSTASTTWPARPSDRSW